MGQFLKWFDSVAEVLLDADDEQMHGIAEEKAAEADQTLEIIGVA